MADQNLFFSYSRSDSEIAIKLAIDLRNAGAKVWLDQLDIPLGAIWDLEIEKALEACDSVLFVVSKSSITSNNALNEVYYALEEGKKVLPVRINECKIPFRIKRLHYIDLSTNYEEGFAHLLKALNLERKKQPAEEEKVIPEKDILHDSATKEFETWQQAEKENSKSAYSAYLDLFPGGKFALTASRAIERLEREEEQVKNVQDEDPLWKEARRINTISSYLAYLGSSDLVMYAQEATQAMNRIQERNNQIQEMQLWEKAIQVNSIGAFQDYLEKYPHGWKVDEAREAIRQIEAVAEETLWNQAKEINTMTSLRGYLQDSGLKKHADEAFILIRDIEKRTAEEDEESFWQKVKHDNTISSYDNYINAYKSGKYVDKALDAINDLHPKVDIPTKPLEAVQTQASKQSRNSIRPELIIGLGMIIIVIVIMISTRWVSSNNNSGTEPTAGSVYERADSTTTSFPTAIDTSAIGINKDEKAADSLYRVAIDYYHNAKYSDAFREFQEAVKAGNRISIFYLGLCYQYGKGVNQDHVKAVAWYTKGAENGTSIAMKSLSEMYEAGEGVTRDRKKANDWYRKAKEAGYKDPSPTK